MNCILDKLKKKIEIIVLHIGIKLELEFGFSYWILLIKEIWFEKIHVEEEVWVGMKNLSKELKNRNDHIWDDFKFYLNINHFK